MATSNRTALVNSGYTILNGTSTGKNDDRFDVWVEYKVESQSVENNTSTVKAFFYAALKSGKSSTTKQNSGLDSTFSVGGTTGTAVKDGGYDFTSPSRINELGSFFGNIKHNTDGTKTIAFNGSFTTESDYIAGGSISKSVALKAIARATYPTLSTTIPNIGSALTIYTNRASSAFTHKLTVSFAGKSETIANNVDTSYVWNIPYSYASRIPDKTSATCTLTCETFNGSTSIGKESREITLRVPNNATTRPKFTLEVNPTEISTSTLESFGGRTMPAIYLKGKNRVRASFKATSAYSNIAEYSLTVDGSTYKSSSNVVESSVLNTSGDKKVTVTVTDARGYHTEQTMDIYVYPYSTPTVDSVVCKRYDAGLGEASDEGTSLWVNAKRSYSRVTVGEEQKNFCAFWYRIRQGDNAYSNDYQVLLSLTDGDEFAGIVNGVTLDPEKSYEIQIRAYDLVMGNDVVTIPIPTAQTDFNLNNKKAAFGKYAEVENAVEIADDWNIVLRGEPIASHVIRVWEKDGITYRLWDDGRFDFWGEVSATPTTGTPTSLDGIYYTNSIPVTLDVAFKTCCFSAMPTGSYAWTVNCAISSTANRQIGFRLMRINKNIADTTYTVRLVGNGTT